MRKLPTLHWGADRVGDPCEALGESEGAQDLAQSARADALSAVQSPSCFLRAILIAETTMKAAKTRVMA